ncbi:MAG: hypothetical protein C0473_00985 [Cyanobacteria bacterium DS3.002]|nr:hypothetical protein [Cyanobacteria bacterium DS3.002]MBA4049522.1 hypothetical protein [Cyanobacteria bacterium DS2.008]
MSLKFLDGFQLEMASELSGLKPASINTLRNKNVVVPAKTANGYAYSFADVLTLRVIRQLRDNGVPPVKIYKAHDYLSTLDCSNSLAGLMLAVRTDTGDVLEVGDHMVSLSQYGQLIIAGAVSIIPIGRTLEPLRQNVVELDKRFSQKRRQTVSVSSLVQKYA